MTSSSGRFLLCGGVYGGIWFCPKGSVFKVGSMPPTIATADSNGDGNKANDKDSTEKSPTHKYDLPGKYKVKLTVFDNALTNPFASVI